MSERTISYPNRVLFWNIWGSRHPEALNRRLRHFLHHEDADILCLTEVTDTAFDAAVPLVHTSTRLSEPPSYLDGFGRIKGVLPGLQYRYDALRRTTWTCRVTGTEVPDVGFGSLLVHKKTVKVVAVGNCPILEHSVWGDKARVLQWIIHDRGNVRYLVAHLHGVWFEENTKHDHPARLEQSTAITLRLAELMSQYDVHKVIFGGDLNLDISTQALRLLERGECVSPPLRLRNLIKECDIIDTRTSAYRKHGQPGESMYADYALVGSNVCVHRFLVDTETSVSDHAPLFLEYS